MNRDELEAVIWQVLSGLQAPSGTRPRKDRVADILAAADAYAGVSAGMVRHHDMPCRACTDDAAAYRRVRDESEADLFRRLLELIAGECRRAGYLSRSRPPSSPVPEGTRR